MRLIKWVFTSLMLIGFSLSIYSQDINRTSIKNYKQLVHKFEWMLENSKDESILVMKKDYQHASKEEKFGNYTMVAGGLVTSFGLFRMTKSFMINLSEHVEGNGQWKVGLLLGGVAIIGAGGAFRIGANKRKNKIINDYLNSGIGSISIPEKDYVKTISTTCDGLTFSMQF